MDRDDAAAGPSEGRSPDGLPAGPLVLPLEARVLAPPSSEAAAALDALARLLRPDDAGLAALDRRLTTALAMQGRIIEALLAEKDRQDAEALAVSGRLDRLEATGAAGLRPALDDCAARLADVLLHLESDAAERLLAGGRPLRAALAGLSAQIAALDARLAGIGRAAPEGRMSADAPAAEPDAEPGSDADRAMRRALAQALGAEPWGDAAA